MLLLLKVIMKNISISISIYVCTLNCNNDSTIQEKSFTANAPSIVKGNHISVNCSEAYLYYTYKAKH